MPGKEINNNRRVWNHEDQPDSYTSIMTFVASFVIVPGVIYFSPDTEFIIGSLLLLTLIVSVVFASRYKKVSISIDSDKGILIKTMKYPIISRHRKYPLQKFESVKLWAKDALVEDGYRVIRYTVVLSGGNTSLELLSTDTESEAKKIQKELSAFLGLSLQEASLRTIGTVK